MTDRPATPLQRRICFDLMYGGYFMKTILTANDGFTFISNPTISKRRNVNRQTLKGLQMRSLIEVEPVNDDTPNVKVWKLTPAGEAEAKAEKHARKVFRENLKITFK